MMALQYTVWMVLAVVAPEVDVNFETIVHAFEEDANDYRFYMQRNMENVYLFKKTQIEAHYHQKLKDEEVAQRTKRSLAIAELQQFIDLYPEDIKHTPQVMFRLAELHYEKSYDQYLQEREAFDAVQLEKSPEAEIASETTEPMVRYEKTIQIMQKLMTQFPNYQQIDGAYYLLGYCLAEQNEANEANAMYLQLVAKYPKSRFAAESWLRIGEFYFDTHQLVQAISSYREVIHMGESPFYDKALYKLAWTHYRGADAVRAPEEFERAVESFALLLDYNEKTKVSGQEKGADLRDETLQYMALCFADEKWGGITKVVKFLTTKNWPPYSDDVLAALGDIYFDQTRFALSIKVFHLALQKKPTTEKAPSIQEKIIAALEKDGKLDDAAKERFNLITILTPGSVWFEANRNNATLSAKLQNYLTKSLTDTAAFYHHHAQTYRKSGDADKAKEYYTKAATTYALYLEQFPHDPHYYSLNYFRADSLFYSNQFTQAAQIYEQVRDSNRDNKYLENSAYSTILAYENAIESQINNGQLEKPRVLKSSERTQPYKIEKKELSPIHKQILEAYDVYIGLFPQSLKAGGIAYKAAELLYAVDDLEAARQRFFSIMERFPTHEVFAYAANLYAESYLLEKNLKELESFSRHMLDLEINKKTKKIWNDLKCASMFRQAEMLAETNEVENAVAKYTELINENPNNLYADSALNNIAVLYEKGKRYDAAATTYQQLIANYPQSKFVDNALFRTAINRGRFFEFDEAKEKYEELIDHHAKSPLRADAVFNIAVAHENLQEYNKAAGAYKRYCDLFNKKDDVVDVCLKAAGVFGKAHMPQKSLQEYKNVVVRFNKRAKEKSIHAKLKMAQILNEMGRQKEALKTYDTIVKAYSKHKKDTVAPLLAEAQFHLVDEKRNKYNRIKIVGNTKVQKKLIAQKAKTLKIIEQQYNNVLVYQQAEWSLGSLYRMGQLYEDFSQNLLQAPCPKEIQKVARSQGFRAEEVCDEYRVLLEEQALPVEDKAVQAFAETVKRARSLQIKNKWVNEAYQQLNKYRPDEWPLLKPSKFYIEDRVLLEESDPLANELLTNVKMALEQNSAVQILSESKKVLQQDEQNAYARVALARTFRQQKKYELAELALSQISDKNPASPMVYHEKMLLHLAKKELSQAIEILEGSLQHYPDISLFHNNLAALKNHLGVHDQALSLAEKANALNHKQTGYLINLGNAQRGLGHVEEAKFIYEQVIESGNALGFYNLGLLFLENDIGDDKGIRRFTRARECFEQYMKLVDQPLPVEDRQVVADYFALIAKSIKNEQKRLERNKSDNPENTPTGDRDPAS